MMAELNRLGISKRLADMADLNRLENINADLLEALENVRLFLHELALEMAEDLSDHPLASAEWFKVTMASIEAADAAIEKARGE